TQIHPIDFRDEMGTCLVRQKCKQIKVGQNTQLEWHRGKILTSMKKHNAFFVVVLFYLKKEKL
ncbi:MAG: hypothetical protein J6X00_02575, partial [Clostridia bacterium]|nr:hypothetical protein [Clostridia bacterium]